MRTYKMYIVGNHMAFTEVQPNRKIMFVLMAAIFAFYNPKTCLFYC